MQDARSSNSRTAKASRWSIFHLGISAFAALAGVVFAGIQAFSPTLGTQPINVTVALDGAKPETGAAADVDVEKTADTTDTVNVLAKSGTTAATLPASGVQNAALTI